MKNLSKQDKQIFAIYASKWGKDSDTTKERFQRYLEEKKAIEEGINTTKKGA